MVRKTLSYAAQFDLDDDGVIDNEGAERRVCACVGLYFHRSMGALRKQLIRMCLQASPIRPMTRGARWAAAHTRGDCGWRGEHPLFVFTTLSLSRVDHSSLI